MNKKHPLHLTSSLPSLYDSVITPRVMDLVPRTKKPVMIVFSHLRWEFVTQRPQHLMNRLAKYYNIYFIEEPVGYVTSEQGTARVFKAAPSLTVLQPRIPSHDPQLLKAIINKYIHLDNDQLPILWFYSPSFIDMVDVMPNDLIIFDCMDELSAFKGAPQSLKDNEKKLLQFADVVFTGGQSLYESKKQHHHNVYCFPSSVDAKHFKTAQLSPKTYPKDVQHVAHPVVGYYGVVDERIDTKLLGYLSKKLPQVSFVIIGPVVKIDPATLPQAPNLHYLGGKDYQELPTYLSTFDAAMMPFAYNRSTKFISPTKTLEYMAAHKPIVSTAIYDVARAYQKEVYVGTTKADFVSLIHTALHENQQQRRLRSQLQQAVIDQTSWDQTATQMHHIIQKLREKYHPATKPNKAVLPPFQQLSFASVPE